jgi:hypothetical protein
MALSFHRSCLALKEIPSPIKARLMQSCETMIERFARSIHATDPKESATQLYVSLINLRDCREILDEAHIADENVDALYDVVHQRLERLCLNAAEGEKGQLRAFG